MTSEALKILLPGTFGDGVIWLEPGFAPVYVRAYGDAFVNTVIYVFVLGQWRPYVVQVYCGPTAPMPDAPWRPLPLP